MDAPAAETSDTPYDLVPYIAQAYPATRPDHLWSIAHLFGLAAPDPAQCRVLELGCASGDNLIGMAHAYPKSQFVGVDYALKQIEMGRGQVRAIGLTNLALEHMSIADVGKSMGQFDYIIAHGILSWVPAEIRGHIYRLCGELLSTNGIAYLSYNTLPGWNQVRTARDIMLFHSRGKAGMERIAEAKKVLGFVAESAMESQTSYRQMLANEHGIITKQPEAYVFHDHLEDNNNPFYFHEVAGAMAAEGLQYLGEASVGTMHLGKEGQAAAKFLGPDADVVRLEQYTDYLTNRRFRSTLFCRQDVKLDRTLTGQKIMELWLETSLRPDTSGGDISLTGDAPVEFARPNTKLKFTARGRASILLLARLGEHAGKPMRAADLITEVAHEIGESEATLRASFAKAAPVLLMNGGLTIHSGPGPHVSSFSDKPLADPLVRFQAQGNGPIVNTRHLGVKLDSLGKILIRYLDGTRDKEALAAALAKHFTSGELSMRRDDKPLTDAAEIRKMLGPAIERSLAGFARDALLIG